MKKKKMFCVLIFKNLKKKMLPKPSDNDNKIAEM